jgi:hypothetical protein
MSDNNIPIKSEVLLFLGTPEDAGYKHSLKPLVGNATVFTVFGEVSTLTEIVNFCKKRNITGVICTQIPVLLKLLAIKGNHKDKANLDDYQGSYFLYSSIEFVFIQKLELLKTGADYQPFITRRFISKLAAPNEWYSVPAFQFEILTTRNYQEIFNEFSKAIAISVDIETLRDHLRIRCIGYTALFYDGVSFRTKSVVLPIKDMFAVSIMRKFNWELKAPKVLQNGKYDISYLSRYNAVLYNYLWDTVNMFHSWYSELPKDLAFLGAFFVREAMYWKDLADTQNEYEYYRYNALDTWTTIHVFMAWILQAPDWAKRNYKQEFPVVFPCHLSEMTGLKRDMERLVTVAADVNKLIEKDNISLSKMLGTYPNIYNVNSAPQNTALRTVLGCKDIDSSDEKSLKKIANRHPLNARIANKILDIRGNRKLESTYLVIGTPEHLVPTTKKKDLKIGAELNGRILYSINPHGTDTGRMASREHAFWCGFNIQNIPRGPEVKQTIIADAGFRIAEADLKQAETRDTAYVSGDPALLAAINSPRDFHALNASAFFGVPYESVYCDATGKTLDKALRDLSKRTNHGANYLMGEGVLVDTMGEDKVWEAKRLLRLPRHYELKDVAHHLLEGFHHTYKTLRLKYYPAVVHEVMSTNMLVSHTAFAVPETWHICDHNEPALDWDQKPLEGWTRYCFGNPQKNKLDKNSLVAHVSQSLNAKALNEAYIRVFYEIALNPKYSQHFKLCAQIHDSILFQFREGHEYLMDMVAERMQVPIRCLGYDGVIRTFTVPADVKNGKDGKGALRWSETE